MDLLRDAVKKFEFDFRYRYLTDSYWDDQFSSHGYRRYAYYVTENTVAKNHYIQSVSSSSGRTIYLVENGTKRMVPSMDILITHGWDHAAQQCCPLASRWTRCGVTNV